MKSLISCGAVLLFGAALVAQGLVTTPAGGLTVEGPYSTYTFGWYADARYQQADGNHKGGKPFAIREIAFRMDYQSHTSTTGMGRTWTRITLDISETTNFDNMGNVWTNNITTTPSRVFDNKWSWPSITGYPLLKPDVWGGVKGQLRFPFTKPWPYTASNDILMDYTFRGGTLANNGTWAGSTAAPPRYKTLYSFDPNSTQSELTEPISTGLYFPYTLYKP